MHRREQEGKEEHSYLSNLTISWYPADVATNNGDCPPSSRKLISAPELSKHLTTLSVLVMMLQTMGIVHIYHSK
jgi:hypothetical protein